MKHLLTIALGIITSSTCFGQVPFNKSLGSSNWNEIGMQTIRLSGGDLLLMGNISSGSVNEDILLIRMTSDGQSIKWQKSVGTPGKDFGNDMVYDSTSQSIFILGQTTQFFNASWDGMMMRLDTSGRLIWLRTLGDSLENENIKGADFLPGYGIAFTGYTTAPTGLKNNVWSGMLDTSGTIIWDRFWTTPENEVGNDITFLPDGSVAIVGDQNTGPNGYDIIVARYSSTGDSLWEIGIRDNLNGGSQEIIFSANGDLIISGESFVPKSIAFDVSVSRVDTMGNIKWHRFLPGTPEGEAGFTIIQPDDRHFIISGYGYSDSTQNSEAYVWLVDTAANLLQQKYFGGPNVDIGYHLLDDGKGWFYMTGLTGLSDNQILFVHDHFELSPSGWATKMDIHPVTIYPNPINRGTLHFSVPLDRNFELIDLAGRKVFSGHIHGNSLSLPHSIPNGYYLFRYKLEERWYHDKLYIQR